MNPVLEKYLQYVLMGVCVLFLVLLFLDMTRSYTLRPGTGMVDIVDTVNDVTQTGGTTIAGLEEFASVIERPLFNEDRRPVEAVPLTAATQARTPVRQLRNKEQFQLSAVIITEDKRIALIQSGRNGKLHKLMVGDELLGWQLTAVEPEAVSLKKGNEVKRLELQVVNPVILREADKIAEKQIATDDNTKNDEGEPGKDPGKRDK